MPTLGNALDFAKYEARNVRAHQLGTPPSSPVTGQLYYNTADNTLYWWDGTSWTTARGGTAPDATGSGKGLIQLAGDLTGTAASPQIAAGVITDADVNPLNKDGSAGVPSLRTIGVGALQAMAGSTTLNAILPAVAAVNLNSQKITALADPTAATDGANKQYVDGVRDALSVKLPVYCASTGNVNIATDGNVDGYHIDGVATVPGFGGVNTNRVLLKNQTDPTENGVYRVNGLSGSPQTMTRATDMDSFTEFPGALVVVLAGIVNANTGWLCTAAPAGAASPILANAWTKALPSPDATTTTKGLIQLAGDLAGTAASPQIAAGVITDADVNAANKDGVAGTASMRTLGFGAQQAHAGTTRLDQIAAPTADVGIGGFKLTSVATPVNATDGANKNYVDNAAQGLDAKQSVRAASAYGVSITLSGAQTVDGIALANGDRVLVKDQPGPGAHGIYVVNTGGAWARASDMDTWAEVPGAFTWVEQGTTNADTGWVSVADQGGTIGTTGIDWVQFSGAGAILGGSGLTKTGNTLDVNVDNSSIEVAADILRVKAGGITNAMLAGLIDLTSKVTGQLPVANGGTGSNTVKSARVNLSVLTYYSTGTHAAGTTISIPQTLHGLGTTSLMVQVIDRTSTQVELPDIAIALNGDVTITYGVSVAANSKQITIHAPS